MFYGYKKIESNYILTNLSILITMSIYSTNEEDTFPSLPPPPPTNILHISNPAVIERQPDSDTEHVDTEHSDSVESEEVIVNHTFVPGTFIYIKDINTREMLSNAWLAITQLELWNYMKLEVDSYMFSDDPKIMIITRQMEKLGYDNHTGYTFGFTMRTMQYIAKYGEEQYKTNLNN
jgi:hypothetical protein